MRPTAWILTALALLGVGLEAQTIPQARINVLAAEDRRAPTEADVATLRTAARGVDVQTAIFALRAIGRLERPALITDLLPALRYRLPETRAEAAHAIGQAAQGWIVALYSVPVPAGSHTPASVLAAFVERLNVEDEEASVRAAMYQSIGRLPYRSPDEATRAEATLLEQAARHDTIADRLGIAQAFDTLIRAGALSPPSPATVALLGTLATAQGVDPTRDVRVRRVALEILIAVGSVSDEVLDRAFTDADAQVRRLAVRAATARGRGGDDLIRGLDDPAPLVRLEALDAARATAGSSLCALLLARAGDVDPQVAIRALDYLEACGDWPEAVRLLERLASDRAAASHARTWQPAAHAIVALALANPERARVAIPVSSSSNLWQVRVYAVRAAAVLGDRDRLLSLSADPSANVADAALRALGTWTPPPPAPPQPFTPNNTLTADNMRRLAAPRAILKIRGVGAVEFALLTNEAPATVLRFVQMAEAGDYDGLTFHQVVPGVLARGGSPAANNESGHAASLREELGPWPNVRGTMAMLTPQDGGGNGQFFINLADNPRFDHQYTVFAQVLNAADLIDQILEGDVIDTVEIIP